MPAELEFTGERFIPGEPGTIAYEHGHRYAFALRHARGRRVLDAACGEGYGTALLASVAGNVTGVDSSREAIAHARHAYAAVANARFQEASVTELPLADATIDVVVSFETIEHLAAEDQPRMLSEFARVLTDDGLLVLSSPNRRRYSDARDYRNPFHLHELYREDLAQLLAADFPQSHWHHQLPVFASALWSEGGSRDAEAWIGDGPSALPAPTPDGLYYVVIAAKRGGSLPQPGPWLSLFHDREDSELERAEAAHAEVLRLDALLRERDAALDRQTGHIHHLEELVAVREFVIVERDTQLAACNAAREARDGEITALRAEMARTGEELEGMRRASLAAQAEHERNVASFRAQIAERDCDLHAAREEQRRIQAAIAAQERIILYRQSVRWWLQLPWVRARSWWQQKVHL